MRPAPRRATAAGPYGELAVGQVVVRLASVQVQGRLEVPPRVADMPFAHLLESGLDVTAELHLVDPILVEVEPIAAAHEFDRMRAQDGA